MVELRYIKETGVLEVSCGTRKRAEEVGAYLFEKLCPSGDSAPTGVTGTYDSETGQLLIFSLGSDSMSDEVYANLVSCFSGVGVDMSKGDRLAHTQFDMRLDRNVYSGNEIKELLGRYGYDVRLPGEVPEEQDGFKVEGLNVGPPVKLESFLDELQIVKL